MNYDEAKKLTARAEELAQAVRDGKEVRCFSGNMEMRNGNISEDDFFQSLIAGTDHRIAQPKTRRPWTQAEAEAHLGWVLVAPIGKKALIVFTTEATVRWSREESFSFNLLSERGWQVHPIGQPENLKPAYVEE